MVIIYKFLLYFKYVKHCIFKIPVKAISFSTSEYKNLDYVNNSKNKIYELYLNNGKTILGIFNKYIHYKNEKFVGHYYIYFTYHWTILGYKNSKTIYNCNFNEFKQLYTTIFYPHLINENQITSDLIMDTLSEPNYPEAFFRIQTFKKLKNIK